MADYTPNDKYKDSLFRIIFGDHKENALSLYNAINGSDYSDASLLEITTLRDAVYIGIKNDVSFMFNDDLNLYEHQATINLNMPMRGLGYFADMYKAWFGSEETMRERLYGTRLVPVPAPHYYVFYNGTDDKRESYDLHLSEAYDGSGDIEVTAHVINVNAGMNGDLMSRCKPLKEYSKFVERVRDNKNKGMDNEAAVDAAIDSSIEDGILTDILRKERGRVKNSLISALTDEEITRLREYEREMDKKEAREEGLAEGRAEGRNFERLVTSKLSVAMISDGRTEEFLAALNDNDELERLFAEYGILVQ